ncbi:MAG: matrixin family metalloprotease [Chloroflexota bacterium]|nr:matrixin family metalloprotease [Chloroflexota bacterium]
MAASLLVSFLAVLFLAAGVFAPTAEAYTMRGVSWSPANAHYVRDASFNNYGTGWINSMNTAVQDWNSFYQAPFYFWHASTSGNHIQTGNLGCGTPHNLGQTNLAWNTSTNNFTSFTIIMNTACGDPYYDGTQGSSIPSNYYDLKSILRHELGHALGLCHSSGSSSLLMYASRQKGIIYPLDSDAINGD